jgi:hypothetical protein
MRCMNFKCLYNQRKMIELSLEFLLTFILNRVGYMKLKYFYNMIEFSTKFLLIEFSVEFLLKLH